MPFWAELKRRNVFKVGAAYVLVAWIIAQVASVFAPALSLPDWTVPLVSFLLILGFPVAVFLAWAYELTPDGIKRTDNVPIAESVSRRTGRHLNYIVTALLAAAVVVLVLENYVWTDTEERRDPVADGDEFAPNSIAVLPFVNMSPDPEQEYFSDGLSEELLNQLAQIEGLSVTGRTSSFAFKGQNVDLRTIGEMLDAAYVLEGSVRKVGDDLRITAQLINAASGYHLWSQTFRRELNDVFAVQEEISLEVARALSVELGVTRPQMQFGGTDTFEAYDLFLKGRSITDSAPERAIEYFRASIALDPAYAAPWMGLTTAYGRVLQAAQSVDDERQALGAMEETALRTIELAPERWEGQNALLWMSVAKKDWLGAYRAHLRAQELAARAGVRMDERGYANFFHQIGLVERALAENRLRAANDPLNGTASFDVQIDLILLGRYDEALAEFERSKDLPRILNAMEIFSMPYFIELGDGERVRRLLATRQGPINRLSDVWDSPEEALAVLREIAADPGYLPRAPLQSLLIFAAYYGDSELAVEFLRRAYLGGGYAGFFLIWHPMLSETRRTAGFRQFARDVGFVDLWREMGDWGDHCRPVGADDFECT
jgi:TolB-like protein